MDEEAMNATTGPKGPSEDGSGPKKDEGTAVDAVTDSMNEATMSTNESTETESAAAASETHTAPEKGAASKVLAPTLPSPEPAVPAAPQKKWYVVQAYSGYENKVKLSLIERIKQAGMEDSFGEILIPKENVQETRGGSKRVTTRNFYPGYIFVQMDLNETTWHLIKDTPKVSGFVGGRHPAPVPAGEINTIAQQVADGAAKPKPRVVFEQGDHVRVTDGAFANFTGTIEEVKPEKQKVRVLVSIFGRATPVELDYVQVEKTA
jgi:transcriptional antiterminator NusG